MAANAIRNIHVPAYWPVVFGVQADENSGVFAAVKNTMAIESIPIIVLLDDDMPLIELSVEVAIDIPDMVAVGDADMLIDIVILLSMSMACGVWVMQNFLMRQEENTNSAKQTKNGASNVCK